MTLRGGRWIVGMCAGSGGEESADGQHSDW